MQDFYLSLTGELKAHPNNDTERERYHHPPTSAGDFPGCTGGCGPGRPHRGLRVHNNCAPTVIGALIHAFVDIGMTMPICKPAQPCPANRRRHGIGRGALFRFARGQAGIHLKHMICLSILRPVVTHQKCRVCPQTSGPTAILLL